MFVLQEDVARLLHGALLALPCRFHCFPRELLLLSSRMWPQVAVACLWHHSSSLRMRLLRATMAFYLSAVEYCARQMMSWML
jgi:hypothetical protein